MTEVPGVRFWLEWNGQVIQPMPAGAPFRLRRDYGVSGNNPPPSRTLNFLVPATMTLGLTEVTARLCMDASGITGYATGGPNNSMLVSIPVRLNSPWGRPLKIGILPVLPNVPCLPGQLAPGSVSQLQRRLAAELPAMWPLRPDQLILQTLPPYPFTGLLSGQVPDAFPAILTFTSSGTLGEETLVYTASNSSGVSEPATVQIRVVDAPLPSALQILQQPTNQSASPGATVEFQLVASGPGSLAYQWLFNGYPLPNATNAALWITNVQPDDAGSYLVAVGSGHDLTYSVAASLTLPQTTTGYANWIAQQAVPANQIGLMDDPDQDGIPNIWEYAQGLNAKVPDPRSVLPRPEVLMVNGERHLGAVFRQPKPVAPDLDYLMGVSVNLRNWTNRMSLIVVSRETFDNYDLVHVCYPQPLRRQDQGYMQFQISPR